MPDTAKKYHGKVLLFGEYALIHGSPALACPTELFSGSWNFDYSLAAPDSYLEQALTLNAFHAYCTELSIADIEYQQHLFQEDLEKGLFFEANIPIGYGVGSSGAITAALFDQYFLKPKNIALPHLKNTLGIIESFFHGKSSGFDPLICYLDKAVKSERNKLLEIDHAQAPEGFTFFLINTGNPRKTAPLVKHYLDTYEADLNFQQVIQKEINPLNEEAIRQTQENDGGGLFKSIEAISRIQWSFFEAMIPANTKKIWEESLTAAHHRIKLCGAGGGGFLLGISKNMDQTKQELAPFECLILT